jgi:hypothetical protein
MAYVSNESGREDVWVARFPQGGDRQLISMAGGTMPAWRRDGRELYYTDHSSIFAVAIQAGDQLKAGAPERLFGTQSLRNDFSSRSYDVGPDGRFLLNTIVERKSLPLTLSRTGVRDWSNEWIGGSTP